MILNLFSQFAEAGAAVCIPVIWKPADVKVRSVAIA